MKQILISIILTTLAFPCSAQWKYEGTNGQVLVFGVHGSSLFKSFERDLSRINPNGSADTGIDFTRGNITSFASLGRYFFANSSPSPDPNEFVISYVTSDNGSHWSEFKGGLGVASDGSRLFGTYQYFLVGPYIAMSRDSGVTWDSVASFNGGNYVNAFATNGACIYATTIYESKGSLWRSLDTGARGTWTKLSPPFLGTMMTLGTRLFMYQNYRSGTAGANNGILIQSRDSGVTWDTIRVDSGSKPEYISSLATDGRNLFTGGVSSIWDKGAYFGNGLYVSTDTGQTWRAENDGLTTNLNIEAMCVYDTFLYISTNNNNYGATSGISYATYYRPIHEMTDSTKSGVQSVSQPQADTLEVFPNPATGLVTIRSGSTSILGVSVLNLLGENVLDVPNTHQSDLTLDISKLASGTYFLQIQTANGNVLRKIVKEE